jgi:hypothetical protein
MKLSEFLNNPENERFSESIRVFREFFHKNFDSEKEKNLIVTITEDDTILIEWIFKDFRFGFCMEEDPDESSFYFVSNKKFGELMVSGLMNDPVSSDLIKIINERIKI